MVSFHNGSDTVIFISTATNSHRLMSAHSAPTQKLNLKSAVDHQQNKTIKKT